MGGPQVTKRVLLPLAAAFAFLVAAGVGAADTTTNISGSFKYIDCGPEHAVTVSEKSSIELNLVLSESSAAYEVELRGPFGDVTRSDGAPNSQSWRRDVFTAGTYALRICGKQRAITDPAVSYNGTVKTTGTTATPPQGGGPKPINSSEDTRSTLRRVVTGAGAVATPRGTATFTVRTVNGVVKLTYTDAGAKIRIRAGTKVAAKFGSNSVTLTAAGVRVTFIDQGKRRDRMVVTAPGKGYRVAGILVRGSVTVL